MSLRNCTILTALGLASLLSAQTTKQVSIPSKDLTTEVLLTESGLSTNFLANATFYAQIATEQRRGMKQSISEIAMRQDGERNIPFLPSRSWSKLELHVAETDLGKLTTTFSTNYKTASATAFSGKVSLAAPGKPNKKPMPWGTTGLKFPFSKPFAYSGTNDLLFGFMGSGGKLGAGSWSTAVIYPLDGVTAKTHNGGASTFWGRGCVATGQTKTFRSSFTQIAYAKKTGNPALDDKIAFAFHVRYGRPGTNFVQAFTHVGTTKTSVQFGKLLPIDINACNLLMVDTRFAFYNYGKTDTKGNWDTPLTFILYSAGRWLVGIDLYTQVGLQDGKKLLLSATSKTPIVGQPGSAGATMIYAAGNSPKVGTLTPIGIPVLRMTYK